MLVLMNQLLANSLIRKRRRWGKPNEKEKEKASAQTDRASKGERCKDREG